MAIETGGAAFPIPGSVMASEPQKGMTLRDWFAGQAMRGLLSNSNFAASEIVHMEAYAIADRLIRERNRG